MTCHILRPMEECCLDVSNVGGVAPSSCGGLGCVYPCKGSVKDILLARHRVIIVDRWTHILLDVNKCEQINK